MEGISILGAYLLKVAFPNAFGYNGRQGEKVNRLHLNVVIIFYCSISFYWHGQVNTDNWVIISHYQNDTVF